MIISHSRNFIFVATPKVASQSIRRYLRTFIQDDDWEQCGYYEKKRLPIPHLSMLGTGHLTLQQLKPFIDEECWGNYLKFAIVRNPVDRFLSASFFLNKKLRDTKNVNEELRQMLYTDHWLERLHFRPQYEFLYQGDQLLADRIGHYESLESDLADIVSGFSPPIEASRELQMPELNRGKHRVRDFVPDSDIVAKLHQIYSIDFEAFGYPEPKLFGQHTKGV